MSLRFLFLSLIGALYMLCGCESELDFDFPKDLESDNSLSLSVRTSSMDTKADNIITGSYLPDGSRVGVYVRATNGEYYDGINYSDYVFKASGTGSAQTWRADSTIKLSATEGYCYAYYPREANNSSTTISTNHTVDLLYSGPVSVNDKNKNVNLTLRHVFSNIRFALKRGTYGGIGKVTRVAVKSSGLCFMGGLNLLTGELSGALANFRTSTEVDFTLTNSVQYANKIVVPYGVSGTIFLYVTIDGQEYSVEVPEILIQQGYMYTYTLTVNAGQLALSGVTVGDWGYNSAGSPTITAAGYSVSYAGDYANIAVENSVSGNTITIKAYATNKQYYPNAVSISGTATLTQSVNGNERLITISNISSNVTVTFNGCTRSEWLALPDGVFYVNSSGQPSMTGSSDCIGVALISNTRNQRFMIEKNESNNASYAKAYTDMGVAVPSTEYKIFFWGEYQKSMLNKQYSLLYPGFSSGTGYLPYIDGTYVSSNGNFFDLPYKWPQPGSNYAIVDVAGKEHSAILMVNGLTMNNSTYDSERPTIGKVLKTFLESSDALGYTDWYIPSLSQLALMYVYIKEINNALSTIGGQTLKTSSAATYWSSSESDGYTAFHVLTYNGYVQRTNKYSRCDVRFIRNLP